MDIEFDKYGDVYLDLYAVIRMQRKEILRLKYELTEECRLRSESIDLLMEGESLRQKMMFDAILGKFPPKVA